mmetsp:Transcript_49879/g.128349  ORF Transcript_49879/g.128349 Transcript_49879/m.128349 type:complete len:297 (-) Transcript_49879:203-1093(-)
MGDHAGEASYLAVILDVQPSSTSMKSEEKQTSEEDNAAFFFRMCEAASNLVQSHLLMSDTNAAVIVLSTPDSPRQWHFHTVAESSAYLRRKGIQKIVAKTAESIASSEAATVQKRSTVLSKLMCMYRRWKREEEEKREVGGHRVGGGEGGGGEVGVGRSYSGRFVFVCVGDDQPAEYVPLMNAVFSASKERVVIDTCAIGSPKIAFLQQAADLSGGSVINIKPDDIDLISAKLMAQNLITPSLANVMVKTEETDVDYRASCLCHSLPVSKAYVCSVCLSVYCEERKQCMTCNSVFE